MKKIEELLNINLGNKFSTPKKINRSNVAIDETIIDELEGGNFTSEMIESLARRFPIFHYRSCITIHGNWPQVSRSRIGSYKNVIQNSNGSVEILYSAIDRKKVEQIREGIRGTGCKFSFLESSTNRVFRLSEMVTKETFDVVRARIEPIARALSTLPIYGYLNLYVARSLWGGSFLTLDIHLLAVKEENIQSFILKLCDITPDEYSEKRLVYQMHLKTEEEERQRRSIEYKIEAEESRKKMLNAAEEMKPLIAHLAECNDIKSGVLVKVIATRADSKVQFAFYRYDGSGSFGRWRWSRAYSDSFTPDVLTWVEQKQQTSDHFKKLAGCRLVNNVSSKTVSVSTMTSQAVSQV